MSARFSAELRSDNVGLCASSLLHCHADCYPAQRPLDMDDPQPAITLMMPDED
jgi:hypothetical protein